jgi:N,N'-diacetyllegionaminate synthase
MSVICVIPARGGSKRIRDKNLRTVGGVSLVGRAVFAAREFIRLGAVPDARIIVDTDSEEIAAEARAWGAEVPFLRAPELATDTTSSADSTLALMDRLQNSANDSDVVILLQPTSPLRSVGDIWASWARFIRSGGKKAITTVVADDAADHVVEIDGDGTISRIAKSAKQEGRPRQQLSRLSGAVYVIPVALLKKHRTFVPLGETVALDIPADRSVDVDEEPDLAQAEGLLRRNELEKLAIGGREIGGNSKCFIIAEAGVNHNGDVVLAHRLVDIAVASGSDAVKFQTFDPALLVSDQAPKADYQLATTSETQSQRQMLDALALPQSAFRELAAHAREAGILFLSTPFDERSADFLEELGCPAFKVASGELTNHRLLRALAAKERPMLVSTGMATMAEVADAIDVIRSCDNRAIALFHCVTNYPAAPRDCNLEAMSSMRTMFGVPVGWSDHTDGIAVSIAAAAMGAELIEKHFTIDRTMDGPDHRASLESEELTQMVRAVRDAQSSRGDAVKRPAASELANLPIVRRSLHAARDLAEGHALSADDLVFLRPGGGIPPQAEKRVLGRHLTRAVSAGERIDESDVR